MSNNNYILKLLGIKDQNIKILEDGINEVKIKGVKSLLIKGTLSYKPNKC